MKRESYPKQLVYVLPNLFTASGLFAGVLSMFASINGEFEKAAWLIFIALIFDGLDGRVARLTNTCSRFGLEFDSLADVVSFGVAPALLVYMHTGEAYGRLGMVVCTLFVLFGAIRLARFNVTTVQTEPSVFIGVPIPTAAVFMAVFVLLFETYSALRIHNVVILIAAFIVSLLMVSNIRYPSFKKVNMQKFHYMRFFVFLLVGASLVFLFPIEGIALLFTLYILYGPLRAAFNLYNRYRIVRGR